MTISAQEELRNRAASIAKALQATVGTAKPFNVKCAGAVYKDIKPLTWTPEQVGALEGLCLRLALAQHLDSPADPETAEAYKADLVAIWKRMPGLRCGIGAPENAFLGKTQRVGVAMTWARPKKQERE